jgi:hypothetical protein
MQVFANRGKPLRSMPTFAAPQAATATHQSFGHSPRNHSFCSLLLRNTPFCSQCVHSLTANIEEIRISACAPALALSLIAGLSVGSALRSGPLLLDTARAPFYTNSHRTSSKKCKTFKIMSFFSDVAFRSDWPTVGAQPYSQGLESTDTSPRPIPSDP